MKHLVGILLCLALVSGAGAQKKSTKPPEEAWNATDLKGKKVRLLEAQKQKATVLLFITPDCPISNSYAPDWNAFCKTYTAKHIGFYLVYVSTDAPAKEIEKHYKAFGYSCPALRDRKNLLARRVKATVTPECVVLSPKGGTLYQGRIDDRYIDFGVKRYAPKTHDLHDALESVISGKKVAVSKTRAVGCFISP